MSRDTLHHEIRWNVRFSRPHALSLSVLRTAKACTPRTGIVKLLTILPSP